MSVTSASSWLHHLYSVAGQLRSIFNRRIPVGWTLLAIAGAYGALYVAADAWNYFVRTPMNARGRNTHTPLIYVISGLIRLYRGVMGLDGTRTKAIKSFVTKTPKQPYKLRFLQPDELSVRRGPRPDVVRNGVPHRQVAQILDADVKSATEAILASYADQKPDKLYSAPSVVEAAGPALFLKHPYGAFHPDIGTGFGWSGNSPIGCEFLHVHDSENSVHMCLAPLDAAEAIEKGWAIRFPAAGCGAPQGHVMVYAPRDMTEVEVVRTLVGASVSWITSQDA